MGVTILHGRNAVDIDDRRRALVRHLDPQLLNSSTLEIKSADAGDIRAAITTPGFFGTSRVVVIQGVPTVDKATRLEWSELEDLLVNAPVSTSVVMVTFAKIPANRRLLKTAKSHQWSVELYDLVYGRELVSWTQSRAERAGCKLGDDAAEELLSRLFPTAWQREDRWNPQTIDMRLLATEIEKLAAASGDAGLSPSLVRELVADRSGVTAFRLNDETFEGRAAGALAELDKVLANGEAPERVIGQIGYQPLVLLAAALVQRCGADAVAEAAGVSSGQLKATVSRKSGWRNQPAVAGAVESLRRAEWMVKTGRSPSTESVIVPLVAEIAEGFKR